MGGAEGEVERAGSAEVCRCVFQREEERERDPPLREDGEHIKKEEGCAGTFGGEMLLSKLCGIL